MISINPQYHNRYQTSQITFNQSIKAAENSFSVENIGTDTSNSNKKKDKKIGRSAVLASILGIGLLFLSTGVQKTTRQVLEKIKNHFNEKLDSSLSADKSKKNRFYEHSVRKINSFLRKSESINNITSLKDILFMKAMFETKPTKKIHQCISEFFEQLSVNTIKKSYKNTENNFNKMYKTFDNLDSYILKTSADEKIEYKGEQLTKRELIEHAKDHREYVRLVVNTFIAENSQNARHKWIKDATAELYSKFWDESFKDFWTKNNKFKRKEMWQTFIAAEQIKGNKTDLADKVAIARNMLSYTNEEKGAYLTRYLKNLESIIQTSDNEGAEIMKRLQWFIKDPKAIIENKNLLLKEIDKLEKHNIGDNKKLIEDKETNIKLIRKLIDEDIEGDLQKMLDIYYHISPFELTESGALRATKKAVSSFDRSVQIETEEFFDKVRDLALGSAPTDVLTLFLSCGMITYGLGKAKTKDEKTTVLLTSGIPIVGGVAASLVTATKLVSGGKSLALGFISGILLNQIGKITDALRKNYNTKHLQQNQ